MSEPEPDRPVSDVSEAAEADAPSTEAYVLPLEDDRREPVPDRDAGAATPTAG
jgi:hypothetical protein